MDATGVQKKLLLIFVVVFGLIGCDQPSVSLKPLKQDAVILAFGDSLTFGTGAQPDQSYPAVLAELTGRTVINSGVPGEISSAGRARLSQLLQETKPDLVILCHGGNDLLRKQSRQQLQANLQAMIDEITGSGAQVLLVAVPAFSLNLAPVPLYLEVAQVNKVPVQATALSEILTDSSLKADQVHPNALGYQQFAQSIYRLLIETDAIRP
ncbi:MULTISPECIES: GDSL-type esterase/lipase family protein [unclassified Methylophaga]|jgi:lysophospholipase L1-like esterase|uniref:GDSL-type esterase/lipase family protein n=1 Tax=unclassified Methylophaga TaxID=2629249 RepID=UPI000C982336|nr:MULTISPECIES: GDSL-type esterase/lipase family protein [unclassified Methylophaga]MAK65454.1 arylesterase [Methylophaga sp.]MAY16177.1 arylesterase [Methylophaga sp.]MBN47649.1 arylesterase [Methylophaga sp.]HAO25529.1 arylesterase [Methylophaga sp.]HCD04326.1 arylesterase [Methylophaga sp.]|tara:strand:+ start:5893 stop:6522 length:630 start_codon:yes stop_codon:yes gene_type:complete